MHSIITARPCDAALAGGALYRLMAWLSPAFPIGSFAYSSGIEWAVEAGDIDDAAAVEHWLTVMLEDGGGFCDAVLLAHAHAAVQSAHASALRTVAELALALAPSKERLLETTGQGRAFFETCRAAWPAAALDWVAQTWDREFALPVAVGAAGAAHGIELPVLAAAYLQAYTANLITCAVRLIPLGQTDGQRVLAALEPVVGATASRALATRLEDAGSAAFRSDIASMRHETQYTRLFRS
ncbi:MAG: urease accessory protein UreF [Xanthobacteraceae bacterium]